MYLTFLSNKSGPKVLSSRSKRQLFHQLGTLIKPFIEILNSFPYAMKTT